MNKQIQNEFYSAYLYLGMSAYFEAQNLPGSAKWMRAQYEEERTHALKFYDYVNDRGGRVTLGQVDAPPPDFESPVAVWEQVLEHEQKVTAMIHELYTLAVEEHDLPTQQMLGWFINEQVEEEKNALLMLERFKKVATQPASLVLFDGHLTKRGE